MGFGSNFFINKAILFFIFLNVYIKCSEENIRNYNSIKNDIYSTDFTPYPSFLNIIFDKNLENDSGFYPEIKKRIINLMTVQTELIFKEKIYIFNLEQTNNLNKNDNNNYIIHFYPLDCHIKIAIENNKSIINTTKISNYDYDAFSIIIPGNELNSTIKLKTLITSNDEYKKNRTYHLIINSFQINELPELNIAENKPIFLYFNNNLTNISLLYNLNKEVKTNFIFVSFFIKERVKFEVKVDNSSIHKTISYIDNFIIPRENIPHINIMINRYEDEEKEAVLIVKIEENYSAPRYFQRNILNLEFIETKLSYQYFYMEVFKGEEGQIFLNNKKYEGFLIGKIIEKGDISEEQIMSNVSSINNKIFPDVNNSTSFLNDFDFLTYYEYEMKLSFKYLQTSKCEKGCYLLITYYSKALHFQNLNYIKGGEYTLYARIWDREEFSPQIINIPMNEYIFGTFDPQSINNHYYSIFIPDNIDDIIIEIQKNIIFDDIYIFSKKGIVKINSYMIYDDTLMLNKYLEEDPNDKILINLNCKEFGFDNFEKKYISFCFGNNYYEFISYYFKIVGKSPEDNFLINHLDINKPNLCETTKINENDEKYSCFFLINNQYKDLTNEFVVYGYGHKKVEHFSWLLDNDDYYSIDFNNIINSAYYSKNSTYLIVNTTKKKKPNYVLIKLESSFSELLTVITNYYGKLENTFFIQIYSYKIYTVKEKKNVYFKFNFDLYDKFRLIINNTDGGGVICFDHFCNKPEENKTRIRISQKNTISFIITKDIKMIDIIATNFLMFNIKMDYITDNSTLKELTFNHDFTGQETDFPLGYYLKEVELNGADVNFYFLFNNNKDLFDHDFLIVGYIVDYDIIKLNSFDYIWGNEFIGKYDKRTNNGLIIFDKENIENDPFGRDKYYLIFIYNKYNDDELFSCSLKIYSISKNSLQTELPINVYISGSFDLTKNKTQSQRYYIQDFDTTQNIIIEFSSNYKNIELKFNNNTKENNAPKTEGGKTKYYITIPFQDNINSENYFEVQVNEDIHEENEYDIKDVNYMIKYYVDNSDKRKKKYNYNLSYTLKELGNKGNLNTYSFIITNKEKNDIYNQSCEFFYHLNIYEKNRIINGELLNTTAIIHSESMHYDYIFSNTSLDEIEFKLSDLKNNEIYVVSLLINIKENEIVKETEDNNAFIFEIKPKKKNKNILLIYLIIGLVVFIIIILFAFFIVCRNLKRKNKDLKEQVQALSFSSGIKEDIITKEKNKSVEDKDYETTFI